MDRTQQPEYVPVGLHVDMNVQLKLPDLYQILDKQVPVPVVQVPVQVPVHVVVCRLLKHNSRKTLMQTQTLA